MLPFYLTALPFLSALLTFTCCSRVQFFGNKIREYEVIRDKISGMASRLYATESLAYLLASNMDRGMTDYQIEAAVGKGAWPLLTTAMALSRKKRFACCCSFARTSMLHLPLQRFRTFGRVRPGPDTLQCLLLRTHGTA